MRQNRAGKLVPTLLAEIRRNYQKQHSHKNPEGTEKGTRHPPNLPPSSSVPLFPPSNAETPGDLWPCVNLLPADSRNNHIPKGIHKKPVETSQNPCWQQGGDNRDPHTQPSIPLFLLPQPGACWETLELQRSPTRMNGVVCALGQIYPGSPGTGRAGSILGKLPRCN